MAENQAETLNEATEGKKSLAVFWLQQIRSAGKTEKDWRDCATKLVERFRDEKRQSGSRFNIFFANVSLLKGAVYSQTPQPDVRRRNLREDPELHEIGREVAEVIERSLNYCIDYQQFDETMEQARDDMLIPGRGIVRVAYEVDFKRRDDIQVVEPPPPTGPELFPTQPAEPFYFLDGQLVDPDFDEKSGAPFVEQVDNERVEFRYVFWGDVRIGPARTWEDVPWIAFRHAMTKDKLREEFGKRARGVPLTLSGSAADQDVEEGETPADPKSPLSRAEVWEVWFKAKRQVLWVATGHDKVLRTDADPLRLQGFFPMPKPLYAIQTTDSMVPVAEFEIYRDQANELDDLQSRIRHLTRVLKAVVLADGDLAEILDISNATDGKAIPITRPEADSSSVRDGIFEWPIDTIANVIGGLTQRAEFLKQAIYEVTGISDLLRGATKATETATAQQIKGNFGQLRMEPRSQPMARFVRDLLRLAAEIKAEMFEPSTLEQISGIPVTPQMVELMREERLRNTVITVATDATVMPDVQAEKQEAVEYAEAVGGFLERAIQVIQVAPQTAPLYMEVLKAISKPFKFGRTFEDTLERLTDQLVAASQPAEPPPEPAPEMEVPVDPLTGLPVEGVPQNGGLPTGLSPGVV